MEWRLNHVGQMAQSVQDYSPLPKRNRKAPEGLISGAFRLPLRTIHFILPTGIIAYALCNTFGNTFQMYYITHLLISC